MNSGSDGWQKQSEFADLTIELAYNNVSENLRMIERCMMNVLIP